MKRIIAMLGLAVVVLLSGCATKLENFTDNDELNPTAGKGIVVIAYESDTPIYKLVFSGPAYFSIERNLYSSKHSFVVTTMPAGTYDITRIKVYNRYYEIKLGSDRDENWKVNIEPNKINYIGHFNVDRLGSGFRYKIQTKNEATLALTFLQENYPSIMGRYPLVFAKDGPRDDFFNYVERIKGEE